MDCGLTQNSILLLFLNYLVPKRENPIYINKDENPSTISTRYAETRGKPKQSKQ
jgi:hypothetical protein